MSRRFNYRLLSCLATVLLFVLGACASDTLDGEHVQNQAPTVWLAAAPPEGSIGTYTVQLYWGGWDPDGEISKYEYYVTDNVTGVFDPQDTVGVTWGTVVGNDSLFTFSADSLTEDPTGTERPQRAEFQRSHTFFIRAVDEVGLRSHEPAYRSFTSRTISPEVRITTPRADLGITPADMPPISTIEWAATDFIDNEDNRQDPDSVQWAMVGVLNHGGSYTTAIEYLRSPASAPDWYPWSWYKAPLDSGKKWTTPPLEFGQYVFAIRAKDEAGAITPVLDEPVNVRRIKIADRLTGPSLVVSSPLIGNVAAASCNYPLTILDIPTGVPVGFTLSACAESYGGTVTGYRYGWDILDPNDPSQWEIDYTPFVTDIATIPPRTYNFGTHTFTSEVIDNSGFCTRIEIKFNIIRFTGERNLLIIDDYFTDRVAGSGWSTSNGAIPNDTEHDAFWLDMVSEVNDFDPARDVIEVTQALELPLTTVALYKNVIWSASSNVTARIPEALPLLQRYVVYRSTLPPPPSTGACSPTGGGGAKVVPNLVGLAMQSGVHFLISGFHPVQNVVPRINGVTVRWPMIPTLELERTNPQTEEPSPEEVTNPPGRQGWAPQDLCVDVIDYAWLPPTRARQSVSAARRYCPVNAWRSYATASQRDDGMRAATSVDANFPTLALRQETAGPNRAYAPNVNSIDVEVYNPYYFRVTRACQYIVDPKPCFQPIYVLDCFDTTELTYQQPIAFWSAAYEHVVSTEIPGAVGARSAVFGFPLVYCNPSQVKEAVEYILFDEWQLPRRTGNATASASR